MTPRPAAAASYSDVPESWIALALYIRVGYQMLSFFPPTLINSARFLNPFKLPTLTPESWVLYREAPFENRRRIGLRDIEADHFVPPLILDPSS